MKTTAEISKNKKQRGTRIYCNSSKRNLTHIGKEKIRKKNETNDVLQEIGKLKKIDLIKLLSQKKEKKWGGMG